MCQEVKTSPRNYESLIKRESVRAMAKGKSKNKEAKETVQTPSQFGSHASMANEELTAKIGDAKQDATDPWRVLTDERGNYATRESVLDSQLADPLRCADLAVREERLQDLVS